jgi:mRNA interferase RelE/StbE
MGSFAIEWRKSTKKDLRKLPTKEAGRVVKAVEQLSDEPFPRGVEKLSGSDRAYRIRVGDYRVVYKVFTDAKLIWVERVRHRKDVYRRL